MKLASNVFKARITCNESRQFKYTPKGDVMFVVQGRSGNWIPITAIVFSDNGKNAIKVVKDSIAFVKKHSVSQLEKKRIRIMKDLKFEFEVAEKNMLYITSWADNAGPF